MNQSRDTIAYRYKGNVYLNITNRCPAACVFCIRHTNDFLLEEHQLRLRNAPDEDSLVKAALAEMSKGPFGEIVFCGMGEPLMRPEVVVNVSCALKKHTTAPIRLDTCGLGNAWNCRDLTQSLSSCIEIVSISLNAGNANDYAKVCPTKWGTDAWYHVLDFVVLSIERFSKVQLSIVHPDAYRALDVRCPINLEECRRVADMFGIPLIMRGQLY